MWIDAKRLVPIKREVVEIQGDRRVTHFETFTRVDLESEFGLDRFRIPQ